MKTFTTLFFTLCSFSLSFAAEFGDAVYEVHKGATPAVGSPAEHAQKFIEALRASERYESSLEWMDDQGKKVYSRNDYRKLQVFKAAKLDVLYTISQKWNDKKRKYLLTVETRTDEKMFTSPGLAIYKDEEGKYWVSSRRKR